MADHPYAFAPEPGEKDHGLVFLANERAIWHVMTPDQARDFAQMILNCADYAEETE